MLTAACLRPSRPGETRVLEAVGAGLIQLKHFPVAMA